MKEIKEFLKAADIALEKVIEDVAETLIDRNPEDYNPEYCDYGCYNNGVGWASYGGQVEYDEDKAREDAIEKIADSFENGETDYYWVLEDENLCKALANLIRMKG